MPPPPLSPWPDIPWLDIRSTVLWLTSLPETVTMAPPLS